MPDEWRQGFDRLSPNGVGSVFGVFVFPIILSLSKGRPSPIGWGLFANDGRAKQFRKLMIQPLMPLEIALFTNQRWNTMNSNKVGTVAMTAKAITSPHWRGN
jgi:hypothetical protein